MFEVFKCLSSLWRALVVAPVAAVPAEELRLHVQETDGLTRERRMLEEENTRLTRELTLRREVEEQFAKRGSKQARDIKDARARVVLASSIHYTLYVIRYMAADQYSLFRQPAICLPSCADLACTCAGLARTCAGTCLWAAGGRRPR